MIALGDAIRALKRAGLEADARRLGFEALFAGWPRVGRQLIRRHDAMTIAAAAALEAFLEMLAAERGASRNTLDAYRRDLDRFSRRFLERRGRALGRRQAVRHRRLPAASSTTTGLAPASRARRLSAIRQLFKFLVAEGVIAEDPTHGFAAPEARPRACRRRCRSPRSTA